MNQAIEDAIVASLVDEFPDANIFTGKVIQGVADNDIIVNTVYDQTNFFKGSRYRQREMTISVTVINPPDEESVTDKVKNRLKEITANGVTHYPDAMYTQNSDGKVQVLIDLIHLER
jgi:hypothetical protein